MKSLLSVEEAKHLLLESFFPGKIEKLPLTQSNGRILAEDIISVIDRKNKWEKESGKGSDSIIVTSVRKGNIPGIHKITYDSQIDFIEIQHSARSRRGFALGAIMAAEFIKDKKGFFTMNDLLKLS